MFGTTYWYLDLESKAYVLLFTPSILFFSYFFRSSVFFNIIMLLENKNEGAGPSRVHDFRYSKVTEGPPAAPVTRTGDAFQQLPLNDEAPPFVQQKSWTPPVEVQTLVEDLRFVCTILARLLDCPTKMCGLKWYSLATTSVTSRLSRKRFIPSIKQYRTPYRSQQPTRTRFLSVRGTKIVESCFLSFLRV